MPVRVPCLRLLPAVAAAALLTGGQAMAQTVLRGAQDEPELTTKGQIAPLPPAVKLKKPAAVMRIRAKAAPALRTIEEVGPQDPTAARPAVDTGTPDPTEALGWPKVDIEPIAPRPKRRPVEEDPYAALGIDLGTFLLKPSIEVDFGYDDNPGRQPGPVKASPFATVTPKLDFASDWSRSELRGTIVGSFSRYPEVDDNRPTLNATVDGRIDVQRDTTIETQGRLALDTERLGADGVSATGTVVPRAP